MASVRLLPQYRGIRVRPYMRFMNYILFSCLFFPFLVGFALYIYVNLEQIQALDYFTIGLGLFLFLLSLVSSIYLTWFLQEATPFFKKLERLGRLSFFLYENKFVYEKKKQGGSGQSVKFPKIYLQQGKYELSVHFKMAGNKFQDKFKKIGGALEDTFFMDFKEVLDEPNYKVYKLAYSAYLNRITVPDVSWDKEKGVELMKGFYWDFISDPHLLVSGGTGGGKTVLLESLVFALSKIGVVDICDPKRADFVTMSDIAAFEGRVFFEISDIVSRFENAVVIMLARYDFIRSEMKRLGHKSMKKFYEYGLEPYFFVCDEYNALMLMLSFKDRERVDNAIGQLLFLGRQAGCFGILAMQKPSREDLGSKLQANINFRISVGRLDETGYDNLFGPENRNKEFKYLKYLGGRRVYGRGYASVYGEVAREFYSPLLTKKFSFFDEFSKIERHTNQFDPLENSNVSTDILNNELLRQFAENASADQTVDLEDIDIEEMEELVMEEEQMIGAKEFSKDLGKSLAQLVKLVAMLEENNYRSFIREEGEILFSVEDVQLIERLFEKKEEYSGTWKELLSDYFG